MTGYELLLESICNMKFYMSLTLAVARIYVVLASGHRVLESAKFCLKKGQGGMSGVLFVSFTSACIG